MSRDPLQWLLFLRDIAAFAIAIGGALVLWYRRRSSQHWPVACGHIETALACDINGKWFSDLLYSYKVGTEYHSGQIRLPAKSEHDADQQVARWKGQALTLRYSPHHPEVSIMRTEDQSSFDGSALQRHKILL